MSFIHHECITALHASDDGNGYYDVTEEDGIFVVRGVNDHFVRECKSLEVARDLAQQKADAYDKAHPRKYRVTFLATVDMVVTASSPEAAEESIRERFIRSRSVDELQNTPLPRGGFILGVKAPAEGYEVEEW